MSLDLTQGFHLPKDQLITAIKSSLTLIFVPSFIRIERDSDTDPCSQISQWAYVSSKPFNINVSMSAVPKVALLPTSRCYCNVK